MRGLVFVLLVLVLMFSPLCLKNRSCMPAQASMDTYFGDLVLSGENSTVIEGQFDMAGSIIITENATLTLRNATVNFVQNQDWEHGIVLTNSSGFPHQLKVLSSTLISTFKYSVEVHGPAYATFVDSNLTATGGEAYCWVKLFKLAFAHFENVRMHGLSCMPQFPYSWLNSPYVTVQNSFMNILNTNHTRQMTVQNSTVLAVNSYETSSILFGGGEISAANSYETSSIEFWGSKVATVNSYETSSVEFHESEATNIQLSDDSTQSLASSAVDSVLAYNDTRISLANSSVNSYTLNDRSHLYVFWYLKVYVIDHVGQSVPHAYVNVYYSNSTPAPSTWRLLQMFENCTGVYHVGAYFVVATYGPCSNQSTVIMNGNKQVTIKLDEVEFPTRIWLDPASVTTSPGCNITVTVRIRNVTDLSFWCVVLKYNGSILNFTGAWCPEDYLFAGLNYVLLFDPTVGNTSDGNKYLLYEVASIVSSASAVEGVLFKMNFTVLQSGETPLSIMTEDNPVQWGPHAWHVYYSYIISINHGDMPLSVENGFVSSLPVPTISSLSPENKTYSTDSLPLFFTVDKPTHWMGLSLNGQANVTILGNTTITGLSDASHTLVIFANDTDGNMGASNTVFFTVDTTHPEIKEVTQLPFANNVLPLDNVQVTATVTDNLSLVKQVVLNYSIENDEWSTVVMTGLGNSTFRALIAPFPQGTKVAYIIIAEDNAGNIVTTEDLGYTYQYEVVPEFSSLIISILYMLTAILVIVIYRRKHQM